MHYNTTCVVLLYNNNTLVTKWWGKTIGIMNRELNSCCQQPFTTMFVCLMMLNATFNNISVISWLSVLLVEETGGPVASHWQTLSHNVVHLSLIEIRTLNISGDRKRKNPCLNSIQFNIILTSNLIHIYIN